MKGIITKAISLGKKKKKNLKIVARYLRIKYRISISEDVLERRIKSICE